MNPLPFLTRAIEQDEWAVCKVFNKDLLAAKTAGAPIAATGTELERVGSLGFINDFLDTAAELPPLMDPTFGGDVDGVIDFKGHGAAPGPGVSYLPVKTEEQYLHHHQQPQMFYSGSSPYFSLPAVSGEDVPTAIRRYCKAEQVASGNTTSVLSPSRETGLSTDPNAAVGYAEISSAPSSYHHNQFLQELDDPVLNIADIWKY
jgi:hypothetical protein